MADTWFEVVSDGIRLVAGQWVNFNPIGVYPADLTWQFVEDNSQGIETGWPADLIDGVWVFSPPPPPTSDEIAAPILFQRNWVAQQAGSVVLQLQCLVEADEATEAEIAKLALWKQYVRNLARINEQPGFPYTYEWPTAPAG